MWAQSLSLVRLFATQWTIACQAPLSMGFPRQEYWSGWPFPSPEDLPNPEIEPVYPVLAGGFYTTEPPGKPSSSALNFPKLSESPVSQRYGKHEGNFYIIINLGPGMKFQAYSKSETYLPKTVFTNECHQRDIFMESVIVSLYSHIFMNYFPQTMSCFKIAINQHNSSLLIIVLYHLISQ